MRVKKLIVKKLRLIKKQIIKGKTKAFYETLDKYYYALVSATHRYHAAYSSDKIIEPLIKEYRHNKVSADKIPSLWWIDFIIAAETPDPESIKIQEKLNQYIQEKNEFRQLDDWELIHISALAIRVGLLSTSYELRILAIKKALDYSSEPRIWNNYYIRAKLSALLEIERYSEYHNLFNSLPKLYKRKKSFICLQQLFKLLTYDNTSLDDIGFSIDNFAFYSFVNKKTIAIVGPGKTESKDAKKIDQNDVVVRFNYKEQGKGVDSIKKGLRCDISYINRGQSKFIAEKHQLKWPDGVKWVVCKTKEDVSQISKKLCSLGIKSIKYRSLDSLNQAIFQGTLNALQNAVIDLLRFNPARLKIYHADLMLTVSRPTGYYSDDRDNEEEKNLKESFLLSFALAHEPVTQYSILNKLWKYRKITGDERFIEVMQLGEKEFIIQLQHIYGNAGRISIKADE